MGDISRGLPTKRRKCNAFPEVVTWYCCCWNPGDFLDGTDRPSERHHAGCCIVMQQVWPAGLEFDTAGGNTLVGFVLYRPAPPSPQHRLAAAPAVGSSIPWPCRSRAPVTQIAASAAPPPSQQAPGLAGRYPPSAAPRRQIQTWLPCCWPCLLRSSNCRRDTGGRGRPTALGTGRNTATRRDATRLDPLCSQRKAH